MAPSRLETPRDETGECGRRDRTRPRILMLISHFAPTVGGAENQALQLGSGLVRLGYSVDVVTQRHPGAAVCDVVAGIRVHRVLVARGRGVLFAATYGASLLRHLRRLRAGHAVLHAHHLYLEAIAAAWVGQRAALPTIAKVACGGPDGDFARLRRTGLACGLPLLKRLTRVVAISAEIEAELLTHGFAADQIARIPNGVDVTRFAPARDPATARAQAGFGPETVLFLGRLDKQKGLDTALAAWARVAARRPAAQLVMAGDGPAWAALELQALGLGLGNQVRFPATRPDPELLLRASQVFLLPSRSEGMSNALLEAMATGLGCVASRIGGNSELLEHGATGLLVSEGDTPALADALLTLLENPGLRDRLGRAARAAAVERYGMDRVVRRYADLYAALAGGAA